jgi:hypothetical protein
MYGPYSVPQVRVGDELMCSLAGLQVVGGWHGPMQWPRAKGSGRARLIVCGDLRRAIELETRETISLHWGVSTSAVAKWRKRLDLQGNQTAAGKAYKVSKLRRERITNPDSWVVPGLRVLAGLSHSQRRELGRRVAGPRCWSQPELEELRSLSNTAAAVQLNRSLSAIVNARRRYQISPPCLKYVCPKCHYGWRSYRADPPKACPICNKKLATSHS